MMCMSSTSDFERAARYCPFRFLGTRASAGHPPEDAERNDGWRVSGSRVVVVRSRQPSRSRIAPGGTREISGRSRRPRPSGMNPLRIQLRGGHGFRRRRSLGDVAFSVFLSAPAKHDYEKHHPVVTVTARRSDARPGRGGEVASCGLTEHSGISQAPP